MHKATQVKIFLRKKKSWKKNLCTDRNHSYRRGERMNRQSMDSSECLGVKYVGIFPEVASRWFFGGSMVLVDCMGIFLRFRILLTDDCT
jgi:hypothetical protein